VALSVQIVVRDDLPESVPVAVEFTPGKVTMALRSGMTQAETVEAIKGAWQAILDCFDPAELARLHPRPVHAVA
jgi:hypothetical protein